MHSMIPCSADCVYQKDGYCNLDAPAIVTNTSKTGCVHRIQLKDNASKQMLPNPAPPQKLPLPALRQPHSCRPYQG